jgi:hypothetical protein
MLTFAVSYVRVAGADLALVPVAESFGRRPYTEKVAATEHLSRIVTLGGLTGRVVPVWRDESGRARFFVPSKHASIVEAMTWEFVTSCHNYRITVARRSRPKAPEPVRHAERGSSSGVMMAVTA